MRNRALASYLLPLAFFVLAACRLPLPAPAALPDDCRVVLDLENAFWIYGRPDNIGYVRLTLERTGGTWAPVFHADARRGLNAAHDGHVVTSSPGKTGEALKVRVNIRRDRWMDIVGEGAYEVRFTADNDACHGEWSGVIHGEEKRGKVTGVVKPVRVVKDFVPPKPGEHPRLLIRKQDIPSLKKKAGTEWGKKQLDEIRAAGSPSAQAFIYALTDDKVAAERVKAALVKAIEKDEWFCIGGNQHDPAFRVVEQLIAFDMIHDACDEAFRQRVYNHVADKLEMYYWGAYNTQFNGHDRSNWSLMFRSAAGLMALTMLDRPLEIPAGYGREEMLHVAPPADLKIGKDVPVVAVDGKPVGSWLYAGPVIEPFNADALGDMATARPEAGTKVGDTEFRLLGSDEVGEGRDLGSREMRDGSVDLRKTTGGKYKVGNYLYGILEVKEPGYYMLESNKNPKGVRQRKAFLNGQRVEFKEYVQLDAGKYPFLVRVWNEPVGNWEPHVFWCRFVKTEKNQAMAWHLPRAGAVKADAFAGLPAVTAPGTQSQALQAGADWQKQVSDKTPWNVMALRHLRRAQHEAEGYFVRGLGEFGWNHEGEAYTRHAIRLGIPFALCYRNVFGMDMDGADRLGTMMALCTARTVFSDDGARMQSFNVGGGAMAPDLYGRAFPLVPEALQPAVLGAWNKSLALAAANKLKDPHGIIATHDGLSKVMRFINTPLEMKEKAPGDVLDPVTVDVQKGGYIFRNQWKDKDDFVVQLFANSNMPGGTWSSCQGGTFRIDGLGHAWVVRGQSYGNGASARSLTDYSLYQNMVDVKGHDLGGCPEAWTTGFASSREGSGVVSLDMNEIYTQAEKKKRRDLGIRAVRSFAVDYSGACGAPCLVAVADRLTGTQGENTWQMALPQEMAVSIDGAAFTVTAQSGETLKGTVVLPEKAEITTVDYQHKHEINYHGGHSQRIFKRRAVLVKGSDKDQDFLVVMTLQRGDAPVCEVKRGKALVGKQTISFNGKKIDLDKFKGKVVPVLQKESK